MCDRNPDFKVWLGTQDWKDYPEIFIWKMI